MEIQEKENQEVKRRFQLWVMPSTLELADQYYHSDNCASKSEFIEKAVLFYCGYLSSNQSKDYLASIIPATVKGILDESENRIRRGVCSSRWQWNWRSSKTSSPPCAKWISRS